MATDYKSLNPGLTRIRVDVRSEETGAVVFSHQFLVIWLTVNKPTLSEASRRQRRRQYLPVANQLSDFGKFLGDPLGDGKFMPSPFNPQTATNEDKGLIQIKVTGSFPVVKGRRCPISSPTRPTRCLATGRLLPKRWRAARKKQNRQVATPCCGTSTARRSKPRHPTPAPRRTTRCTICSPDPRSPTSPQVKRRPSGLSTHRQPTKRCSAMAGSTLTTPDAGYAC